MKKLLAMILALMLVLTMTAAVVMADEPEAAEETEITESTEPALPEGFDESTIVNHMVFDFTAQGETIPVENYMTANEVTINYLAELYGSQQEVKLIDYNGEKALDLGSIELGVDNLGQAAIGCVEEKGFFADSKTYMFLADMLAGTSNYEAGTKVAVITVKYGNKTDVHEIVAGQNNTFMFVDYTFNWLYILIAIMCLIVLILLVVIIVVVSTKKKKTNKDEADILNNDVIFEELIGDIEEVAEEVTEAVEETTEEN